MSTAMDKFLPPKDPLQLENRLHTLQALPNERAKQLQKALDQMAGEQANEIQQIDKVRTLIKGKPMAIQLSLIKQHLQVDMGDHPLFQSAESDAERQTSIYSFLSSMKDFCKAKLEGYGLSAAHLGETIAKGKSEQKFVSDFWSWLNGKSSDADHKKTPWGRHPIRLPDVLAYEDSFIDVRYKFLKKMIHLQTFGPSNLKECWLFFKYIVRGDIGDKAGLGFLDDWDKITSEFINIADEAGNMHTISNNDAQFWPRPQQLLLEANPREKDMGDVVTAARSAVAAVSTTPETFKAQPKENSYRSTIPMITIPTTPAAPPPSTRAVVPANLPSPPIQSAVVANPAQIVESENMEVVAPSATNHPANSNDAPLAITAEATQQMEQEAPPAEVPQQPEQMEQEQPKPEESQAKIVEQQQAKIQELEATIQALKLAVTNVKEKTKEELTKEANRRFEQEKQSMEQRKQEAVEAERRRLEQEKLQEVELTKQAAVEALSKQRERLEAEHQKIIADYTKQAEQWYSEAMENIRTEHEEKQKAAEQQLADLERNMADVLSIYESKHREKEKLTEEQAQKLKVYEEQKAKLEQEGQQLVQLYNAQMQQVEVERQQKEAKIAEQENKLLQYEQQQQQIMYQNQNLQSNLLQYEEKTKQQTLAIEGLKDQTKQIAAHNQDLQRQLQHAIGDTENVVKQLMYEREMSVADRQLVEANYNRALVSLQASQQRLDLQRKEENALRDAVYQKWQELLAQQAHNQTTALQEQIQYYQQAYGQLQQQQANAQESAMVMSTTINQQKLALQRQYQAFLDFQNQFRRGLETGQIQVRGMAEGTLLGSQPETMSVEYSGQPAVSGQLIHRQPTSSQPNVVVKPGTSRLLYPVIEDDK